MPDRNSKKTGDIDFPKPTRDRMNLIANYKSAFFAFDVINQILLAFTQYFFKNNGAKHDRANSQSHPEVLICKLSGVLLHFVWRDAPGEYVPLTLGSLSDCPLNYPKKPDFTFVEAGNRITSD